MKIFKSLESGFSRTLKSWKGILVFWLILFILVSVFLFPLRGALASAFGSSMITEKLAGGFDIEVFADLGATLKVLISFFTAGFLMVYLTGFILNSFLAGSLFTIVRKDSGKFSYQEFFRAGSRYFWSFLIISFILTVAIFLLSLIIIGIPLIIVSGAESVSEKNAFTVVIFALLSFLIILPVFLLVADYSRAWKAANENDSCFKALGFGFRLTFSKFRSSYIMMLLLILAQIILGIFILLILPEWKPVTGGGVFLLLIISQLLLYARLVLKTWRYASVTTLMENTKLSDQGN
jgi:hypothetical protein